MLSNKKDGSGKEFYQTTRSIDNFMSTEKFNFYGWVKVDNQTGESCLFFPSTARSRWIAGDYVVYLEIKYQAPVSETLTLKNILKNDTVVLEYKTYETE